MPTWTNFSVTAILGARAYLINTYGELWFHSCLSEGKPFEERWWNCILSAGKDFRVGFSLLPYEEIIYIFAFLLIDLLSVLYKMYRKCFVQDVFDILHPQILRSYSTTTNGHLIHTNEQMNFRVCLSYLCRGLFQACFLLCPHLWVSFTSTTCLLRLETQTRHNFPPTWPFGCRVHVCVLVATYFVFK